MGNKNFLFEVYIAQCVVAGITERQCEDVVWKHARKNDVDNVLHVVQQLLSPEDDSGRNRTA